MRGLDRVVSSSDFDATRGCCAVLVIFVSSIGVIGSLCDSKASCCCANAHSVVDGFVGRAGSAAKDRCVLRAGGGPVDVSIPFALRDAGALRARLSGGRAEFELD